MLVSSRLIFIYEDLQNLKNIFPIFLYIKRCIIFKSNIHNISSVNKDLNNIFKIRPILDLFSKNLIYKKLNGKWEMIEFLPIFLTGEDKI